VRGVRSAAREAADAGASGEGDLAAVARIALTVRDGGRGDVEHVGGGVPRRHFSINYFSE
jgi:hypothetical protein